MESFRFGEFVFFAAAELPVGGVGFFFCLLADIFGLDCEGAIFFPAADEVAASTTGAEFVAAVRTFVAEATEFVSGGTAAAGAVADDTSFVSV